MVTSLHKTAVNRAVFHYVTQYCMFIMSAFLWRAFLLIYEAINIWVYKFNCAISNLAFFLLTCTKLYMHMEWFHFWRASFVYMYIILSILAGFLQKKQTKNERALYTCRMTLIRVTGWIKVTGSGLRFQTGVMSINHQTTAWYFNFTLLIHAQIYG